MARKVRFMAFRERPKRNCGHQHKTAKTASRCALKQKKLYGGTWLVTCIVYS